jgi:hypothetical protein
MPVCLVTVQDDGAGQAGTIKAIEAGAVSDLRPFLRVPTAEHRYLSVYLEGAPTLGEIFFDGFYFSEAVMIDRVTLHARSAPRGGDLQIGIMKNGSVTGSVATLGQDNQSQSTSFSQPISFGQADKFGLKVVGVDGQGQARGITMVIYYR